MFHKKGNIFHGGSQDLVSAVEYREAVRSALTYELGGAGRAAKATIKWTGVSERTAKNWIAGSYGPSGEHLIGLMKYVYHKVKINPEPGYLMVFLQWKKALSKKEKL